MSSLSARETAYQTIRSRIITMELKPGDPLNDRELAEELGISRTPMREALLMLNLARMGIGLSVCAAIIKAHGGEIKAESRLGEGTTIRFWLETEEIEMEDAEDEQ